MAQADLFSAEQLESLHPRQITGSEEIQALLNRLRLEKVELRRGVNRKLERETATLEEVGIDRLFIRTTALELGAEVFLLSFSLGDSSYSFSTRPLNPQPEPSAGGLVAVSMPTVVYCGERRERVRRRHSRPGSGSWQVRVIGQQGAEVGLIEDSSPGGLGVRVPSTLPIAQGSEVQVDYVEGPAQGQSLHGLVRHQSSRQDGWVHLGVQIGGRRKELIEPTTSDSRNRLQSRIDEATATARLIAARAVQRVRLAPKQEPRIRVVSYESLGGQRIVGIVDSCGDPVGAPAILIPPAWGKTKETLLPLARTIVSMFARANKSVTVLRFDGTMRRGESHNDPRCRAPGREHHGFTFSQAVRDIEASVKFLSRSDEIRANGVVLVTYSISAIEGRRAVANNADGAIAGWVSLVGPSDLQSTVQSVAGGIDYLGGYERGLRFGIREILGVEVDIDRTASEALQDGMGFLSDSCRDFENIHVPVTWMHGAFDGWMDLERVRTALSAGDPANRRLLVVPSGHQLRTSRAALEIFSQVAQEVGRIVGNRKLPGALPDLADLEARSAAERRRVPSVTVDVRSFWRNYLLGREGRTGMALMIRTPIYQELMDLQINALGLAPGQTIADLGSGLGALSSFLRSRHDAPEMLRVVELELVQEALRAEQVAAANGGPMLLRVVADLGAKAGKISVPLADASCDAALASLLVSYLPNPEQTLADTLRTLRPGGRIVVSTLRRDADFSKIWGDNASTLRRANSLPAVDRAESERLDESLDSFFNDAARVLDLEEAGLFEFYEPDELAGLLERAGFVDVRTELAFGHPPQAIIASARRPLTR